MNTPTTEPTSRIGKGQELTPCELAAGRYGTSDMAEIWGADNTIKLALKVQGISAQTLAEMYPDIVPQELAQEIYDVAISGKVDPNRVREIEEETGHDIIAINRALAEQVSQEAQTHINKAKTSADTTQPVRALQLKTSLEVIMIVVKDLRDVIAEKAKIWMDVPYMDNSHLYDALPTIAGRPLIHYVELLQSNLDFIKFVYDNSIKGKWADATGNHHSATALGIDGIKLQENFCKKLGVGYMDAPAQIPGLEFEADIWYAMSRLTITLNNLAKFIALGRSDDVNVFINGNPKKQKGSSAMPHKDAKNGNPTTEEQIMSLHNYTAGNLTTGVMNGEIPYARNLAASANSRINFEDGFKFLDHGIRNFTKLIFWLDINEERSKERVQRSFGVVTSQQVMTYLTDKNRTNNPMTREEAHNLMGELAQKAWNEKRNFTDICLENNEITSRLSKDVIKEITDPLKYIGESKKILETVIEKHYKKKTLKK